MTVSPMRTRDRSVADGSTTATRRRRILDLPEPRRRPRPPGKGVPTSKSSSKPRAGHRPEPSEAETCAMRSSIGNAPLPLRGAAERAARRERALKTQTGQGRSAGGQAPGTPGARSTVTGFPSRRWAVRRSRRVGPVTRGRSAWMTSTSRPGSVRRTRRAERTALPVPPAVFSRMTSVPGPGTARRCSGAQSRPGSRSGAA
jgi:hypothetical protein